MADKLIWCEPSSLNATASDCNKQIDIAEVEVCDAMCSANYNLYINGILDPGSPFTPSEDCVLFAGGITITRLVPITNIRLAFQCDDCDECDIEVEVPAVANPCACSGTLLSVTLDATNACSAGDLEYTITGGTGPYGVSILENGSEIYSDTQLVAGTYTYSSTFINASYKIIITDAYGCVKQDTETASGCCDLNLISVYYDCDAEEVITTHFSDCVGAKSYVLKQGAATLSAGVYTGAAIAFPLANGTYTLTIACDDCTSGPVTFVVGCGTPTFSLSQNCSGTNNTITVSGFSGGTAPWEIEYWLGSGAHTIIGGASDPTTVNLGNVAGQTVHVTLKNSEGNTSIPEQSLVLQSCNCFTITGVTSGCDPDTQDKTISVKVSAVSSDYAVDLLDTGNNVIDADIYVGALGTTYTIVFGPDTLAAGTYRIRVRNTDNGCTVISSNIVIEDCISYEATYDCETGLSVAGLAEGETFTVVKGANTYGPYTDATVDLFFVDGTGYTVKVGGVVVASFTADCCNFSITSEPQACDMLAAPGSRASLEVSVSGGDPADEYDIEIYISGGALIGTGSLIGNSTTTITGLQEGQLLDTYVHNATYEGRSYINGAPPNSTDCVQTVQDQTIVCAEANCTEVSAGMTVTADSCVDGDVLFTLEASDTGVVITGINTTYYRTAGCGGGSKNVTQTVGDVVTQIDPLNWEITIPVATDIENCCLCLFYMRLTISYTFEGLSCTKVWLSSGEGSEFICDTFGECIGGIDPEAICNF